MPAMARTKWDDQLKQAAETRGTVTIMCSEGEKPDVAAAARDMGRAHGLAPQIDTAPASAVRVGYLSEGIGQPPVT